MSDDEEIRRAAASISAAQGNGEILIEDLTDLGFSPIGPA